MHYKNNRRFLILWLTLLQGRALTKLWTPEDPGSAKANGYYPAEGWASSNDYLPFLWNVIIDKYIFASFDTISQHLQVISERVFPFYSDWSTDFPHLCHLLWQFGIFWTHLLNQWHLRWRECHLLTCLVITPDGHYITPDGQVKSIIIGSSYDDMMIIIACTILDSRVQVFD